MQNTQSNIEHRDPKSLRLHKLRKHFPAIDKEMPDWIALTDSVSASGVLVPLLITAEGFIADGGWRWEAAKDWQLKEIPVQIIPEEMVALVIAESLICRKQMTRGATLYLMMPILNDIVASANYRWIENVKQARRTNEIELKPNDLKVSSNWNPGSEPETVKTLTTRWGVGKSAFYVSRNIWQWLNESDQKALKKLFADLGKTLPANLKQFQDDLRAEWEPKLLIGDKNLWNVESGIKGTLTGGEHELPQKRLDLLGDALESFATRVQRFDSPNKISNEIRKWLDEKESEMEKAGASPRIRPLRDVRAEPVRGTRAFAPSGKQRCRRRGPRAGCT